MMTGKFLAGGALACLFALAGCGNSSGGGGGTFGFSTGGKTFSEANAEANALLNDISSGTSTSDSDMPTSNSATYRGATTIVLSNSGEPDINLVGEATVRADFTPTGGSVSGTLDNFLADSGGSVTGSLDIENGTIGGVFANEFDAEVNGGLNVGTDTFVVTADSDGEFLEAGATDLYALIFGTTSGSRGSGSIDGDFGATR